MEQCCAHRVLCLVPVADSVNGDQNKGDRLTWCGPGMVNQDTAEEVCMYPVLRLVAPHHLQSVCC